MHISLIYKSKPQSFDPFKSHQWQLVATGVVETAAPLRTHSTKTGMKPAIFVGDVIGYTLW